MDRNSDGSITQDEWRGNPGGFQMRDWNGDGVLSGNEIQPDAVPPRRIAADPNYDDQQDRFEYLDSNRNGRIELREWTSTDATFNRLDRNGDNYLSRQELAGTNAGPVGTTGIGNGDLIYVDANQRWTDTGIDVQAGQEITVNAQGTIQLSEGGNDSATPSGSLAGRRAAQAPVRAGPAGGLIGRVGNSNAAFLGARGTMRAPVSGRLYLSVNDDYLGDNTGEYQVNVTVRGR